MTTLFCRCFAFLGLCLACCTTASAQQVSAFPPDEILARVGPKVVTSREFVKRIELMPWPGKEKVATQDSVKVRALRSLVAEKLFALEAEERGVGNDERTLAMLAGLERALTRDRLYQEEVVRKTHLPDGEMEEAVRRFGFQFIVLGYAFSGEDQARAFARACAGAARPDSIIRSLLHSGSKVTDTLLVSYGDLDRPYEDGLYAMRGQGMTPPLFSLKQGWAVFRILDRRPNPARQGQSASQIRTTLETKARKRFEDRRAQEFLRKFGEGKTLRLDSALFAVLADTVVSYLRADSTDRRSGLINKVDRLRAAFAPRLTETLASSPARRWTLEEVLESLRFFPAEFPEGANRRKITFVLNRLIMQAVEAETFSAEGMRRQYNRSADVREDLGLWRETWKALANAKRVEQTLEGRVEGSSDSTGRERTERTEGEHLARMQRHLQELARRYGVELFEEKLARIPISTFSMVTRRSLGFGGSMIAVPVIAPEWEWLSSGNRTLLIP